MLVSVLLNVKVTSSVADAFSLSCDENNNATSGERLLIFMVKIVCANQKSIQVNQLTFDFYYNEPSNKGRAIALYLAVVVAILSVSNGNSYGGIRFCAVLMRNADAGHGSPPVICATSGWTWRDVTMKMDHTTKWKGTLCGTGACLDGVMC